MKIVINGWPLLAQSGGIGVYTRELLREFCRLDNPNDYNIYGVSPRITNARAPRDAGAEDLDTFIDGQVAGIPSWVRSVGRRVRNSVVGDWIAWSRSVRAPGKLARFGTDLYFGTNFLGVFHPSFKTVITIHDLTYCYYPETVNPIMYRELSKVLGIHAQRAHAVLADSVCTKTDIVKLLGVPEDKVVVVYPGVSQRFVPLDDDMALMPVSERYALPDKFLLFLGTVEPRKNIPLLIEAFDILCGEATFRHGLVIAGGKGWRDQRILTAIEGCPHKDRIVCTGFVADDDLPALYNLADMLVMPSLYEGFGLPVVEALACGTCVVATNVSSLPEVVGDAGLLVDPHSPAELADAIRRLLGDEPLRQSLRAAGFEHVKQFSWEKAARQITGVFGDVFHGTT